MAIRAKDFEIIKSIVVAITVFMMNAKNFWFAGESAMFAMKESAGPDHLFANSRILGDPSVSANLVDTLAAAINPSLGRRCQKLFTAMLAVYANRSLQMHRLVVALSRAILRCLRSAGDDFELTRADRTGYSDAVMFVVPIPITFSRAETGSLSSILRVVEFVPAVFTGLSHIPVCDIYGLVSST